MKIDVINARIDENDWIRCGRCSHKLGKIVCKGQLSSCNPAVIEIKCHSCKTVNSWSFNFVQKN